MKFDMKNSLKMGDLTDEQILNLWKNPDFDGSFRGIRTFQAFLKTDKNIDVPEKRLYNILKNDAIYLLHLQPKRKFMRRKYDVRYYGELLQADIAFMFNWKDYQYFLLLIDCFSMKMFAEPLKSKSSDSVANALKKMFSEFGAPITEIQTDRGKEFLGKSCKDLFKTDHIVYRSKFGQNKANFAENAIGRVKRKMYMLLRSKLNQNWVETLPKVILSFNNTPLKNLGWLKPSDIKTKFDTLLVNQEREKYGVKVYKEPTFHEQLQLQNKETAFNINDYVYLDFDSKPFDKSFDTQVCTQNFKLLKLPFINQKVFDLKTLKVSTYEALFRC
jgi:hypothetical protein